MSLETGRGCRGFVFTYREILKEGIERGLSRKAQRRAGHAGHERRSLAREETAATAATTTGGGAGGGGILTKRRCGKTAARAGTADRSAAGVVMMMEDVRQADFGDDPERRWTHFSVSSLLNLVVWLRRVVESYETKKPEGTSAPHRLGRAPRSGGETRHSGGKGAGTAGIVDNSHPVFSRPDCPSGHCGVTKNPFRNLDPLSVPENGTRKHISQSYLRERLQATPPFRTEATRN
ncbi:unnamed protein product [Lampetra planeri]